MMPHRRSSRFGQRVGPALIALAVPMVAACGLTDLDLNGGAQVSRVKIDPGELSVEIDTVRPLSLVVIYDDGFAETVDRDVTWSVTDTSIASFDNDHDLRGRKRGTTVLEGGYGDATASAMLTVVDLPAGLEVRTIRNDVNVGLTRAFSAELRYSRGDREDVTAAAAWSSDVPDIAEVDAAGVATGRAVGDTVIRAEYADLSAAANLHVNAAAAP